MNTYTRTEAAEFFGITPRTLLQWCKNAGIKPDSRAKNGDRRRHILTQAQVDQLAQIHQHGRTGSRPLGDQLDAVSERIKKLEGQFKESRGKLVAEINGRLREQYQLNIQHAEDIRVAQQLANTVINSFDEYKALYERLVLSTEEIRAQFKTFRRDIAKLRASVARLSSADRK